MSTRWQIAAKLSTGNAGCIYVHHDGYPSRALAILQQHYTDQSKIDRLIALGDCSSVGAEIEECESYRDRDGEDWDDIKPTFAPTAKEAAENHMHGDEEFRYSWDGNQWEQSRL